MGNDKVEVIVLKSWVLYKLMIFMQVFPLYLGGMCRRSAVQATHASCKI